SATNPIGFLLRDFQEVVDKPECTEIEHAEKREPDERIVRPGPEDRRKNYCPDNQDSAHRRSALFSTMQLGQLPNLSGVANRLTNFQRDEFANDVVAEKKRDHEGRDCGQHSPKGDIIKNVEAFELLCQSMEIKHHGAQRAS